MIAIFKQTSGGGPLIQALGPMNNRLTHDATVLASGCAFWAALITTGAWAWGLFVPLFFFSLLVPAVTTALLEGPRLWRPFVGSLPNGVGALIFFSWIQGPASWLPLVLQSLCGGAILIFCIATLALRKSRPR